MDFLNILEILKKHNVAFVSSQEPFLTTGSSYGNMLTTLLALFAEFERNFSFKVCFVIVGNPLLKSAVTDGIHSGIIQLCCGDCDLVEGAF